MCISDWSSDVCSSDLEIQEELRLDQLQLHDREPAVSVADHVDTGIDGRRRHRRQRGFGEVSPRGACVPQFFAAAELRQDAELARRRALDDRVAIAAAEREERIRSEGHTSTIQSLMRI